MKYEGIKNKTENEFCFFRNSLCSFSWPWIWTISLEFLQKIMLIISLSSEKNPFKMTIKSMKLGKYFCYFLFNAVFLTSFQTYRLIWTELKQQYSKELKVHGTILVIIEFVVKNASSSIQKRARMLWSDSSKSHEWKMA